MMSEDFSSNISAWALKFASTLIEDPFLLLKVLLRARKRSDKLVYFYESAKTKEGKGKEETIWLRQTSSVKMDTSTVLISQVPIR